MTRVSYGDPAHWDTVPEPFTAAVVDALAAEGWPVWDRTETTLMVELTPHARAFLAAGDRGELFLLSWAARRAEYVYGLGTEDGIIHNAVPLGAAIDPAAIARQTDRVLRGGAR